GGRDVGLERGTLEVGALLVSEIADYGGEEGGRARRGREGRIETDHEGCRGTERDLERRDQYRNAVLAHAREGHLEIAPHAAPDGAHLLRRGGQVRDPLPHVLEPGQDREAGVDDELADVLLRLLPRGGHLLDPLALRETGVGQGGDAVLGLLRDGVIDRLGLTRLAQAVHLDAEGGRVLLERRVHVDDDAELLERLRLLVRDGLRD